MKELIKPIIALIILIIIVFGLLTYIEGKEGPKKLALENLSQCLAESGIVFYGAFWCPVCAAQKGEFGKSAKNIPYVECSKADRTQTQVCIDEDIQSYPTWKYEGQVYGGLLEAELLAHITGCALPNEDITAADLYEEFFETVIDRAIQSHGLTGEDAAKAKEENKTAFNDRLKERFGVSLELATPENVLDLIVESRVRQ